MLVLSRREDDKILFPSLGISVQILRVAGNKVRVGVDAPPEIKVLREELFVEDSRRLRATGATADPAMAPPSTSPAIDDGQLQRRLHAAAESLNQLYQLCDQDLNHDSERLIFDVFRQLKSIDEGAAELNDRPPVLANAAPKRALLVEDNLNESKLLAGYLRLRSFEVDVATDGGAAIEYLAKNEDPDVVLLDMQMPGMDGPTAIRQMRADEKKAAKQNPLKVYAVSGSDPADYGVDIGPSGVDGWFPKPLDPEALVFRLAFDDTGTLANSQGDAHRKDSVVAG